MRQSRLSLALAALLAIAAPGAVLAGAPTISRFSPSSGSLGTSVDIYGSFLGNASAVKFNGVKASISSDTGNHITATVPAGASTGFITVKTRNGTATSPTRFVVTNGIALSVSTAQPKQTIYISGSGFTPYGNVGLYFDRTLRATISTSGRGTFVRTPFAVPQSAQPGQHPVTAADLASGRSVSKAVFVFTNWPQFRNVPAHTGRNALENTIAESNVVSLAMAWSGATDGAIFSSPAVDNGVVYVGSEDGNLYAFAAFGCGGATCAPLWTAATGGAIHSSPAVANGVVYVGSDDKRLYAFAANGCGSSTCSELWSSKATGGAIESSPVVVNGRVYVGSMDHKLYAYKAAGCGVLQSVCGPAWYSTNIGALFSSPAVANGVVYIGSEEGPLYAFNAAGCGSSPCAPTWYGDGETIDSSPAVANGVVYVGSLWDLMFAFPANGCGTTVCSNSWVQEDLEELPVRSSPAVLNGVVYVGVDDGRLYAYDANGSGILWTSIVTGGPMFSSPAVANGVVYVGSEDHKLYGFRAAGCASSDCTPLWSSPDLGGPIDSSPALANGVVYVGSTDGRLYAFTLNGN